MDLLLINREELPFLYESTYNMYLGHGLEAYKDIGYHFNNMVQKYVIENNHDGGFKSPGFFNLPVCELKAWNWKQSDNMNKQPPCDCCKFKLSQLLIHFLRE